MIRCLQHPYQRVLETEVISCEPTGTAFSVVLADTILYPEGGGQPADHGRIGRALVTDVRRTEGSVLHTTDRPVDPGPVRVEVDWTRRLDHMQQHTAQHLLTALAQDRYGWATTSFHLSAGRCDVEFDAPEVGDSEILALEEAVNAEVRAARPVQISVVGPDEYRSLDVRTRGVPDGVTQIRLIEIAGIDLNTCGGTHVSNTARLGRVQLLDKERVRGGTRLYFVAGDRVGALLRTTLTREAALSKVLSAAPRDHVDAVEKLLADAKATNRRHRSVQADLARCLGVELARSSDPVLTLHRESADMAFLNSVATAAATVRPDTPMLLTAGEPNGVFLAIAPATVLQAAKAAILEILDGRGGGSPGRLQGRGARIDRRTSAVSALSR